MSVVLDPVLLEMVRRSIEADGGDASYYEGSTTLSQGRSRFGSQSPVRFSSQSFGGLESVDLASGMFVPSTPETESRFELMFIFYFFLSKVNIY